MMSNEKIIIENVTISIERVIVPPSVSEAINNRLSAIEVKSSSDEKTKPQSEQMELNLNSESKNHPKQAKKRQTATKRECGLWISGTKAWETHGNFKFMCEKYKLDYNSLSDHSQMKERDRILKRALSVATAFRKKYPMSVWGYRQYDSNGNLIYVDIVTQKIYVNKDFIPTIINQGDHK